MVRSFCAALAFASGLISVAASSQTYSYGADTRAFHFFSDGNGPGNDSGTQYAGGYLNDPSGYEDFSRTPNGLTSSTLDTTFSGRQIVGSTYVGNQYQAIEVPASAGAYASADLSTGKLRVYATDPAFITQAGTYTNESRTAASMTDTLTFSFDPSLQGQYVTVGVRTALDGSFSSSVPNDGGGHLFLDLDSETLTGSMIAGGEKRYFFGPNPSSDSTLTSYGNDVYGYNLTFLANSPISLRMFEGLVADVGGGTVDYSHTATLNLILPQGVTFTSASGVFLDGTGSSTLPESATWATMIAGFALVGGAARRRRRALAAA